MSSGRGPAQPAGTHSAPPPVTTAPTSWRGAVSPDEQAVQVQVLGPYVSQPATVHALQVLSDSSEKRFLQVLQVQALGSYASQPSRRVHAVQAPSASDKPFLQAVQAQVLGL